jgi:Mrp family chromosome partitioning ATPase
MSETIKINGSQALAQQIPPAREAETGIGRYEGNDRAPARPATVSHSRRADPYDALLWRLEARQDGETAGPLTLGLVGCERRTGVTTLAANLAMRAAQLQLGPVLLVEANWDGPRLRRMWRLSAGPGLADLLAGAASFGDCLRPGPAPGLSVLPAGSVRRRESPVLEATDVNALLAEAGADHRFVLFDLPAADHLNQALLVAKRLDQGLLVVRAESTRTHDAQKIADRLADDGVPLAGAVLNRRRTYVPRWLERWL